MNFAVVKKSFRTACLSLSVFVAAAMVSPSGLISTAQANPVSCTLISQYVDANGVTWGIYRCAPGPGGLIHRSCDRGCPSTVWDYRDEQ